MVETAKEIASLIVKQMQGIITPEEAKQLENWGSASAANRALLDSLNDPDKLQQLTKEYYDAADFLAGSKTPAKLVSIAPSSRKQTYWYVAAAVTIAALITTCAYLFFTPRKDNIPLTTKQKSNVPDIPPAGQKATLVLADQSTVNLTDAPAGVIARQGSTTIRKAHSGDLQYEGSNAKGTNTLITPRGGFYMLSLADGSKVWLNADSKLEYPVVFEGEERRVVLRTGQAYFEVVKNERLPFIVETEKAVIRVLGTKFDCKAYLNDGDMQTTLLQGSVKIDTRGSQPSSKILVPGDLATVDKSDLSMNVHQVEAQNSISWVLGKFYFSKESNIYDVVKQLERWYDVDITLEDNMEKKVGTIYGKVDRTLPLSTMLTQLGRLGDFEFDIKGRNVKLYPVKP